MQDLETPQQKFRNHQLWYMIYKYVVLNTKKKKVLMFDVFLLSIRMASKWLKNLCSTSTEIIVAVMWLFDLVQ